MLLQNNRFKLGGVDLLDLCREFGTPVYAYDADTIARQYKKLNSAFTGMDVRIKYACKALSNLTILRYMKSLGAGLDAVSIQEALLGIKAGFEPKEILFSPNGVSFDEIKKGVELGLTIN